MMTKYTKIEQMVHEMLLTDKAIPWTASTSERSKTQNLANVVSERLLVAIIRSYIIRKRWNFKE